MTLKMLRGRSPKRTVPLSLISDSCAGSINAGKYKIIQSNPVSLVAEELLLKREFGESQKSESVCVLEETPIEKILSIPSKLEFQDPQINVLNRKVKSSSLSSLCRTP